MEGVEKEAEVAAVEDLRVSGGAGDVQRQRGMAEDMDEADGRGGLLELAPSSGAALLEVGGDVPFVGEGAAVAWAGVVDAAAAVWLEEDAGAVGLLAVDEVRAVVAERGVA